MERRVNIENVHVWKWISAALLGVLMLLLGALSGDLTASMRYSRLHQRMTDHERMEGHPVMTQRVTDLEEQNRRSLSEIKNKLERQSIVLREIEQSIAKHAAQGN